LSISKGHRAKADRGKSNHLRLKLSIATAICHRTWSRGLRAYALPHLSQSICVDSASQENLTLAALKDAVRLLVYLIATVLVGAFLAPPLFWAAQYLAAHGTFTFLARFDFETFFHRALLVAALIMLWPLVRSLEIRKLDDLQLSRNPHRWRDLATGFLLSTLPLFCCAAILIATPLFSIRGVINWPAITKIAAAALFVPIIEEAFFRGLVLGALLKTGRQFISIF